MQVDNALEKALDEFSKTIEDEFNFLEDEYGFMGKELERLSFEYQTDMHVRIDYVNSVLCVRIEWHLVNASVGVGLIGLENGEVPEKYSFFEKQGFSPAISLSTLVEFLTNGELKDPLQYFGPKSGSRKMMKALRDREELIAKDMKGILATYANWLRVYAGDVLGGDTSIFETVQKYATEKISKDYYGL